MALGGAVVGLLNLPKAWRVILIRPRVGLFATSSFSDIAKWHGFKLTEVNACS